MGDVEIDPAHQKLPDTKRKQRRKQAEHQRRAEKFRHAEHPHLGDRGLEQRQQEAADGEFADIGGDADRRAPAIAAPAAARPQGANRQAISET